MALTSTGRKKECNLPHLNIRIEWLDFPRKCQRQWIIVRYPTLTTARSPVIVDGCISLDRYTRYTLQYHLVLYYYPTYKRCNLLFNKQRFNCRIFFKVSSHRYLNNRYLHITINGCPYLSWMIRMALSLSLPCHSRSYQSQILLIHRRDK